MNAVLRPPAHILVPCIVCIYHTVTDADLVINLLHVITFEYIHKTDNYYHTLKLEGEKSLKDVVISAVRSVLD